MDNVETSIVTLTVGDDTDTTHVTTTSDHGNVANLELDKVIDLASGKAVENRLVNGTNPVFELAVDLLDLDSVVNLDQRIRVADAAS